MKTFYKHIIFDLDGTLSDSREGIFNAYGYAFTRLGLENPGHDALLKYIGPPLQHAFSDLFGLKGAENENAIKVFREYYAAKGLFENKLYDGIKELLEKLVQSGAFLYVATSKYIVYANQVLEHFGILSCFTDIAGADYAGNHATKVDLIAGLLLRNGIHDPSGVIMVGDTRFDIEAAAELDIDTVCVTYGFSSAAEISALDPDYMADHVNDLHRILFTE